MKKTNLFAILLLALVCLLCGCRFARTDGEAAQSRDRLVGVSLRPEMPGEPDGYDSEGNPYWRVDSDEEEIELTEEQFEALMRGEGVSFGATGGEIGPYAYYLHIGEDGLEIFGEWPGETHCSINVTDEGTTYHLEATVYVCDERVYNENTYNSLAIDAVYERADGSLGAESAGGIGGLVGGYELTIAEEYSESDGRETEESRMEIVVRVRRVDRLTGARVLAFDAAHVQLGEDVLDLSAPEPAYAVPEGAAYLLLEETLVDEDGAERARHSAVDCTAQAGEVLFTLYIPGEYGLALPVEVLAK